MTRLLIVLALASCQQVKTNNPVKELEPMVDSMERAMAPGEKKHYLDAIYRNYINQELLAYLEKTHPAWSVPNQNRWYPRLFDKYRTNNSLVNFISGDFDCTGSKDYALIVDKGKGGLAAVAFLGDGSSFKTVELTDITPLGEGKIEFVLTLYKPGKYNIIDPDLDPSDPKHITFRCNSVGIGVFEELYEGGDQVYYWTGNELQSCLIDR